jgi:ATP-binding protein involved in chromosome partitioning
MQPKLPIAGVSNLIAVGSGKGGVGKTTVSVNLAIALARLGYKTGLLDADVYGPNVPLMMGTNQTPAAIGERIQPLEAIRREADVDGFSEPGDKPLVWRGPMLHSVIQQFLRGVDWGELDYLVIDLPPGTGDVQLSLVQTAPLTGAVIVTTPSDVSLEDARKAVHMFEQVRVPLLGLVENMSYLQCPHCNERIDVFSTGGGKRTAEQRWACSFWGRCRSIRRCGLAAIPGIRCDAGAGRSAGGRVLRPGDIDFDAGAGGGQRDRADHDDCRLKRLPQFVGIGDWHAAVFIAMLDQDRRIGLVDVRDR